MSEEAVLRRLAATLAADVAGCSRLMGANEAGTARMLREHRAAALSIKSTGLLGARSGRGLSRWRCGWM